VSRTGVVTQARMTSTRLPGKVLIEVRGRTLLDHHLDRLEAAGLEVYVATTSNAADDPIVDLAERRGLAVHRGSEHDVLARFAGLVREFGIDTVVRVTSDCPLIDGGLVAGAISTFEDLRDPNAYVTNGLRRTFPRGMDLEVFSAEALLNADRHATAEAEREHVTPYLYTNASGRMSLHDVTRTTDASAYRVTLDTPDDLELIRTLIEDYGAHRLDCEQIIALLDENPSLVAINAHVEQKKLGQ